MIENIEGLNKYKIAVIAGGFSSERDISLKSGRAVFQSLSKGGLTVEFIDLNKDNYLNFIDEYDFDIAFIALHGKFGEDGQVQKQLELKNKKYTGSSPKSSIDALDKIKSKVIFSDAGLNVPEYSIIKVNQQVKEFSFKVPCVVKPRFEGSSVGLYVVQDEKNLKSSILEALKLDQDVIVEAFISGREVTVGVLDGKALPVVEIKAPNGIYDYGAKYLVSDTEYIVPAQLSEKIYAACLNAGLKAHNALGCRGFSRTDMRVSDQGIPYVLEVNTIPGLTERSLLPMAAESMGLDFFQLCVKMIETSIKGS